MSIRAFPKRYSHFDIANGADKVVGAIALPGGSRLNNVYIQHSIHAEGVLVSQAMFYGVHAYVVPVLDPDAAVSVQTMWDTQITKDADLSAAGTGELDTGTSDTTPVFEIGDVASYKILGEGTHPHPIFRRQRMLTWANTPKAGWEDVGNDFKPSDYYTTMVKPRVQVTIPSVAMFGVSSPDTLNTVTAFDLPNTAIEWMRLKYLEETIDMARVDILAAHEAGAKVLWETAARRLAIYLEQAVEESAGKFIPVAITSKAVFTFDVTLPGRFEQAVITGQP